MLNQFQKWVLTHPEFHETIEEYMRSNELFHKDGVLFVDIDPFDKALEIMKNNERRDIGSVLCENLNMHFTAFQGEDERYRHWLDNLLGVPYDPAVTYGIALRLGTKEEWKYSRYARHIPQ